MRRALLVVILVATLCGLFSLARARETAAAPAWEYKIIPLTDLANLTEPTPDPRKITSAIETKFNEFGKDGWELTESSQGIVVFKRPKP